MPHSTEPIDHAAEFARPYGVSEEHWAAIALHADRLSGAMGGPDRSLVVGSAKELVESVAKVVLATRHDFEGRLDFPQLMKRTTDALTTDTTREATMKGDRWPSRHDRRSKRHAQRRRYGARTRVGASRDRYRC